MAFWNLTAQLGFLSFDFLLTVLFVFSSVEYSPVYLLRIPFRKECQLAFCIKKLGNLPISPGIGPPISGVDLVPTETAQLDPVTKSKNPLGRVSTARRNQAPDAGEVLCPKMKAD